MSSDMELVESRNGNIIVVYKNCRFSRHATNGLKEITWSCNFKNCKATIITNKSISTILKGEPCHNHEVPSERTDDIIVKRRKNVRKNRKRKKSSCKSLKEPKIAKTFSNEAIQLLRHNMHMEKSVKRLKEETERTVEGLYESLHVTIPSCEEILQINHNGTSTVCFTTLSNLDLMCESSCILIDRTFPWCSAFFHQLLTIYCPVTHQPFAHFLLPEEYCSFYEMFEKLVAHCKNLGMKFEPKSIKSNLDSDDFSFFKKLYPSCSVQEEKSGATESWWKKVQNLLLTDEFPEKNSNLAKWLRWTFPMFYLNHTDVANSFLADIKSQTSQIDIINLYAYYLIDSDPCSKRSQDMNTNVSNESPP